MMKVLPPARIQLLPQMEALILEGTEYIVQFTNAKHDCGKIYCCDLRWVEKNISMHATVGNLRIFS